MGCPRYIGRGNIFARLEARKKAQELELEYFSFYVMLEKKHEREVETLLIRAAGFLLQFNDRSEEHTSELQSLMRISYAVFCLKKNKKDKESQNYNCSIK